MTKGELNRTKRAYVDVVREVIKNVPQPERASARDCVAIFDAILKEISIGRKICAFYAKNPSPRRRAA